MYTGVLICIPTTAWSDCPMSRTGLLYCNRLPNDLGVIVGELAAFRADLEGLAVESTYNGYRLLDGLIEAGNRMHLANTAAMVQYTGLKYTDDTTDALWLAKLLRLGLLPEGYIYPKEQRAVRDLLRKRSRLVQQRTANLLSIQNLMARNRGHGLSAKEVKRPDFETVDRPIPDPYRTLTIQSTGVVMRGLDGMIEVLERAAKARMRLRPA